MRINCDETPHVGPAESLRVPAEFLGTIKAALKILNRSMRNHSGCNTSFSALSGGQTFRQYFDDNDVWINYDPVNDGKLWGWTVPEASPKDIVITRYALKMGRWSTAATIVHELAHLNGAPGEESKAAELQVKACRMKSEHGPYDPDVEG